jgi:hypothetical protein
VEATGTQPKIHILNREKIQTLDICNERPLLQLTFSSEGIELLNPIANIQKIWNQHVIQFLLSSKSAYFVLTQFPKEASFY